MRHSRELESAPLVNEFLYLHAIITMHLPRDKNKTVSQIDFDFYWKKNITNRLLSRIWLKSNLCWHRTIRTLVCELFPEVWEDNLFPHYHNTNIGEPIYYSRCYQTYSFGNNPFSGKSLGKWLWIWVYLPFAEGHLGFFVNFVCTQMRVKWEFVVNKI